MHHRLALAHGGYHTFFKGSHGCILTAEGDLVQADGAAVKGPGLAIVHQGQLVPLQSQGFRLSGGGLCGRSSIGLLLGGVLRRRLLIRIAAAASQGTYSQ